MYFPWSNEVEICSYVELCVSCENGDKPSPASQTSRVTSARRHSSFLLSHHTTVSQRALRQPGNQQVSLKSISCISQINTSHRWLHQLPDASHIDILPAQDFGRQFPPTTTPNASIEVPTASFSIDCKFTCLLFCMRPRGNITFFYIPVPMSAALWMAHGLSSAYDASETTTIPSTVPFLHQTTLYHHRSMHCYSY